MMPPWGGIIQIPFSSFRNNTFVPRFRFHSGADAKSIMYVCRKVIAFVGWWWETALIVFSSTRNKIQITLSPFRNNPETPPKHEKFTAPSFEYAKTAEKNETLDKTVEELLLYSMSFQCLILPPIITIFVVRILKNIHVLTTHTMLSYSLVFSSLNAPREYFHILHHSVSLLDQHFLQNILIPC